MKRIILILVLLSSSIGFSQENPVSIQADTTFIRIGEQILYKIIVNEKENVVFPEMQLDSLRKIEIVEDIPIDTLKEQLEKSYLLTSFDSGYYLIPKQEVTINNVNFFTDSLLINVAKVQVDTTKQKLFPIKSIKREPKTLDDYKHLWWILIPILLLIAAILYFVLRKKVQQEPVKIYVAPINEALERLKALDEKQLLQQHKIKAYYTELTDIVRTYIEKDSKIPALESTTNELIETIIDLSESSNLGIDVGTIDQLKTVLQGADLVKFAKLKPIIEEIKSDRNVVEEILKNTQTAMHKDDLNDESSGAFEELTVDSSTVNSKSTGKRKSFFKKYVLVFVILIVVALSTAGYFVYNYFSNDQIANTRDEAIEDQWIASAYGYPTISLETPLELMVESIQLPDNAFTVTGDYVLYSLGKPGKSLYIAAASTQFFEVPEDIDLDDGVQGALDELEARFGVTFTEIKRDNIRKNGEKGRMIVANFKKHNTENNKSEDNKMNLMFFANKVGVRQVYVTYKTADESARKISERVLNSVVLN